MTLPQTFAEPRQRGVPSQKLMHGVAGDRKPRAGNVLFAEIGERLFEFLLPFGVTAGPVCQTLRNQTQSKPIRARLSSTASGMSSRVAGRPSFWLSSVSQTRVLIW